MDRAYCSRRSTTHAPRSQSTWYHGRSLAIDGFDLRQRDADPHLDRIEIDIGVVLRDQPQRQLAVLLRDGPQRIAMPDQVSPCTGDPVGRKKILLQLVVKLDARRGELRGADVRQVQFD